MDSSCSNIVENVYFHCCFHTANTFIPEQCSKGYHNSNCAKAQYHVQYIQERRAHSPHFCNDLSGFPSSEYQVNRFPLCMSIKLTQLHLYLKVQELINLPRNDTSSNKVLLIKVLWYAHIKCKGTLHCFYSPLSEYETFLNHHKDEYSISILYLLSEVPNPFYVVSTFVCGLGFIRQKRHLVSS